MNKVSWIPKRVIDRYREQPRFDTGHSDERRVRAELRPRTGHVLAYSDLPLSRRVLIGAVGFSPDHRRGK